MRPTAAVLALPLSLLACQDVDRNPPAPGGGATIPGEGVEGEPDAGAPPLDAAPTGDAAAQVEVTGRLCPANDLRFLTACPPTDGLEGIDLRERGGTDVDATLTGPNGAFTLMRTPDNADNVIIEVAFDTAEFRDALVSGPLEPGGGAVDLDLPVAPIASWDRIVNQIGAQEPDGSASLVVSVVDGGLPVPGADVIPPEGTAFPPFFDVPGPADDFAQGGLTGPQGTGLLFGVPGDAGTVDFLVTAGDRSVPVQGVPVSPNTVTFATVDLGNP